MGEKEEAFDLIRSVIMSQKGGVLLKDLNRDFKSMTGDHIPYIKLGYDCMESLLDDIPEVSSAMDSNGQILYTTEGKNCDHLAKLISKQRSTKSKGSNKNSFHKSEKARNFSKTSNHAHLYKANNYKAHKYFSSEPSFRAPKSADEGRIKIEKNVYDNGEEEEVSYKVGSGRSRFNEEKESWYETNKVYSFGHQEHRDLPPLKHSTYQSDSWGKKRGKERVRDEDYYYTDKEAHFPRYPHEKGREHDQAHSYVSSKVYERRKPQPNSRLSMNDSRIYRTNSFHADSSNHYDENYNEYYRDRLSRNHDRSSYYYDGEYARDERASYFPSTSLRASRPDYPRGYRDGGYDEYYESRRLYYPSHDGARSRYGHRADYYWDVERSNSHKYGGYSGDVRWNDNGSYDFYDRKIDVVSGQLVVTIKNT